jgi:hypothetical protein
LLPRFHCGNSKGLFDQLFHSLINYSIPRLITGGDGGCGFLALAGGVDAGRWL